MLYTYVLFRQGSLQYEKSKEDPFCNVRKRLLKFQKNMSVVVVVWRECQQLIDNYRQDDKVNILYDMSFISMVRNYIPTYFWIYTRILDSGL